MVSLWLLFVGLIGTVQSGEFRYNLITLKLKVIAILNSVIFDELVVHKHLFNET